MNIPVSVWIDYFEELSVEQAIAELAKAGYTHGELSLTHLAQLMKKPDPAATGTALKNTADINGYSICQGHLSFEEGLVDDACLERLKPELDLFAAAGISKAVLHANGGKELSDEERYDRWVKNISALSAYVEGTGITLCIENMFGVYQCRTANQLKQLVLDAGGKNLGICLDTGHLHLCRSQKLVEHTHRDFIRTAGNLLQALHITDNNGDNDTHQMPFSARYGVDWKEVMQALRDIDYRHLFNLEILGERGGNMTIKHAKLAFIKEMCRQMFSNEFIA